MTALAIAAGGGGDAVTAAVLAEKLPDLGVSAIMSYSWDRLLIDPVPGPRSRADFHGLIDHGTVAEVPQTAGLRVGQSTLPRLARHIAQPLLLMDIQDGVVGFAAQIVSAAVAFGADEVVVIDVGGDILAEGHEGGLRSPLADSVALAAAVRSDLPATVLVAGIGLDGELSCADLQLRLEILGAEQEAVLEPADVGAFEGIWSWHPSEANGLVAAAANGWRGDVETQRGSIVQLADAATYVYRVAADAVASASLAELVASTTTLGQIEDLLRERRGYSDIDVERDKLANRFASHPPMPDVLSLIDRYAAEAAGRGIDALTIRRVIELAGATDLATTAALRESLALRRPDEFRPPLYLVRAVGTVDYKPT
ncbi:DUF1152 domain-containing protein [Nocardia vinacea]|uniref:DUF1152 domain-containing protein n=1 Tax=Nocardia vinacea TaxID=96468 RepID=UPI002E15C0CB|nr:DUF1152 domain-containing protein [Nocardia vinacea]